MVYVLLGTGFEEMEAIAPVDLLRRANVPVLTVGINGKIVKGSHGIPVEADITLEEMDITNLDMIVLPGGLGGVASCRASEQAMTALQFAWENGKYVCAICAGPTVLADLDITSQKNVTCYPGCEGGMKDANLMENTPCVQDGMLITGTSAGCAIPFGLKLVEAMTNKETAQSIAQQIVIR